ncbi:MULTISPECIES: DUF4386 family protein [unclassified Pseudofrankia]|uniref:DUF4386 family protein n=1 Tax=unclassified Pseudofrankia TaxID=2994372 RepID=UPI0008D9D274|nr:MULTISPECIES: hypothetical protein [unclassified Pseudofrankia]MDT3441186.1 hypothetical protein [Pseudofrankia sp. BMG5.37]OHV54227.1 hypothetical protein BCD48_09050 [Pseudofrankia sp. BMG5.36]
MPTAATPAVPSTSPVGRLLAAACLLLTGLGAVLATALLPASGEGDDVAAVDRFAAHAGRVDAGLAAEILILLLGAATAIAALLAFPRARRLASVAGWLGIISGSAWIGLVSTDNVRAAAAETDHAAGAALMHHMSGSAQFQAFVLFSLVGGLVSMVCLGIALWRSRAVPRWAAALFVAYEPVNFAGGGSGVVGTIANALLLVGFAVCAGTILRGGLPALAISASPIADPAIPTASATPTPAR